MKRYNNVLEYYEVESVFLGANSKSVDRHTKAFKHRNAFESRKQAIEYARKALFQAGIKNALASPNLVEKIPERDLIMNSFKVYVYFIGNEWERCLIYGDNIHDMIWGLNSETEYFLQNDLTIEDELTEFYVKNDCSSTINNPLNRALVSPNYDDIWEHSEYSLVRIFSMHLQLLEIEPSEQLIWN